MCYTTFITRSLSPRTSSCQTVFSSGLQASWKKGLYAYISFLFDLSIASSLCFWDLAGSQPPTSHRSCTQLLSGLVFCFVTGTIRTLDQSTSICLMALLIHPHPKLPRDEITNYPMYVIRHTLLFLSFFFFNHLILNVY